MLSFGHVPYLWNKILTRFLACWSNFNVPNHATRQSYLPIIVNFLPSDPLDLGLLFNISQLLSCQSICSLVIWWPVFIFSFYCASIDAAYDVWYHSWFFLEKLLYESDSNNGWLNFFFLNQMFQSALIQISKSFGQSNK